MNRGVEQGGAEGGLYWLQSQEWESSPEARREMERASHRLP